MNNKLYLICIANGDTSVYNCNRGTEVLVMTSIKTATVNVRIQENVKVEAEAILKKLGLTRATAIDLFYRQIIMHNGIPFSLQIQKNSVLSREDSTL